MEKKISVGYDCYKSIVSDNEDLRNENEELEEAVEQLKKELQEAKSEHTMDQARVVFAHHILNGCRDEQVLIHQDKKAQEVVFWKMKYDKVYSEMEHYKKLVDDYQIKDAKQKSELEQYQKSNKAWQQKYEKLFEKNQITLNAIEELERYIDNKSVMKRCCK